MDYLGDIAEVDYEDNDYKLKLPMKGSSLLDKAMGINERRARLISHKKSMAYKINQSK